MERQKRPRNRMTRKIAKTTHFLTGFFSSKDGYLATKSSGKIPEKRRYQ